MDVKDLIAQGKVKRYLQVRNKLSFEGSIYHVTQRAPGRELLFLETPDYLYMLHQMNEGAEKYNYEMFAFALMTNHLHLLIRFNEANMSSAMKNLFENYAKYFNKKYERKGPVFCKPFRAALCLDDNYLLAASLYIHMNPVKAGLSEHPSRYRWSSCSLYYSSSEKKSFINSRFILNMLSSSVNKAKSIYRKMMSDMLPLNVDNILENPKAVEGFYTDFLVRAASALDIFKIGRHPDALSTVAIDREIRELAQKSRLRKPHEIQARKYLIEQLKSRDYSIIDISKKLNISRTSVYKTLKFTF